MNKFECVNPESTGIINMNSFKGLDLSHDSFAINISLLIGAVSTLQMSNDDALKAMGDNLLDIARDYASIAANKNGVIADD
ncbi:MAG: hypothetical protein ACK5NJ_07965 [Citrobacter portucalensis]